MVTASPIKPTDSLKESKTNEPPCKKCPSCRLCSQQASKLAPDPNALMRRG